MKYKNTQVSYAKAYGVSPRTIRTWQRKSYPLDDPRAMGKQLDAQKNIPAGTEPTELRKARLRKVRLECERLELELAIRKKEFVSAVGVREEGVLIGAMLDAELRALLDDAPGVLAGLSELHVREKLKERLSALKTSIKRQVAAVTQKKGN